MGLDGIDFRLSVVARFDLITAATSWLVALLLLIVVALPTIDGGAPVPAQVAPPTSLDSRERGYDPQERLGTMPTYAYDPGEAVARAPIFGYDDFHNPVGELRALSGSTAAARNGGGLRARLADETGSFSPFAGRGGGSRLTNSQAGDLAGWLGYKPIGRQLRGQEVFRRGRTYIVQDVDSHSGGIWKMARSPEALGRKRTRLGTYDEQLNRIGP